MNGYQLLEQVSQTKDLKVLKKFIFMIQIITDVPKTCDLITFPTSYSFKKAEGPRQMNHFVSGKFNNILPTRVTCKHDPLGVGVHSQDRFFAISFGSPHTPCVTNPKSMSRRLSYCSSQAFSCVCHRESSIVLC